MSTCVMMDTWFVFEKCQLNPQQTAHMHTYTPRETPENTISVTLNTSDNLTSNYEALKISPN